MRAFGGGVGNNGVILNLHTIHHTTLKAQTTTGSLTEGPCRREYRSNLQNLHHKSSMIARYAPVMSSINLAHFVTIKAI